MLPDDLNDIEDDVLYKIEALGVSLPGRLVKEFGIFSFRRPGKATKKEGSAKRYYPNKNNTQVFQYWLNPPAYRIHPNFDGVKHLIQELNLPSQTDNTYYSSLWKGGEYVNPGGTPVKEYQEYTVETFGLKISSTRPPKSPSKLRYSDLPKYWRELDQELIQIWRIRIFHCSPESLGTTLSNPLSPQHPTVRYLEERWHPQSGRRVLLGGLQNTDTASASELQHFFCDAYRILKRKKKMGRPYGTREYGDFFSFYRKAVKTYKELLNDKKRKGKPTQPEVALRMLMSLSSFKKYWRSTGLVWPPISDRSQ